MDDAKQIRMNRIFAPDGKTVIVALDHGVAGIVPLAGLEYPEVLIPKVISSGADAILTTPGIARFCASQLGRVGLILRVDGGPTSQTGRWEAIRVTLSVEEALRLGADAVAAMGIVGAPGEEDSLSGLISLAAKCHYWGVPLLAEMLPGGFSGGDVTIDQIQIAARIGAECGADIIKIRYKGPPEDYKRVITACYRPLVILGGSKQSSDQLVIEIGQALEAGAVGVAVGRNIWQDPYPELVTAKISQRVHA
jgi:fructose-bisphosphate aldolase, class I